MKLKNCILAAFCTVAALSQTSRAALQASLPEFKSKQALQAQAASRQVNKEEASGNVFYTGKPFEAGREGYLFKYRSYNAELNRWTSVDPSGFPDGANPCTYSSTPTCEIDSNGLWKLKLDQMTSSDPVSATHSGYQIKSGLNSSDISVGETIDQTSLQINSYAQIYTTSIFGHQNVWAQITPYFTVTVSNTGMLSLTTSGELKQINSEHGGEGIALGAQKTLSPDGHSLTLDITVDGALAVTGVSGATVGTEGVNLSWNQTNQSFIFSTLSMGFVIEAVE